MSAQRGARRGQRQGKRPPVVLPKHDRVRRKSPEKVGDPGVSDQHDAETRDRPGSEGSRMKRLNQAVCMDESGLAVSDLRSIPGLVAAVVEEAINGRKP